MPFLPTGINFRHLANIGLDRPTIYALQGAVQTANAINEGAIPGQTAVEIKTAYESNADTNAFTDDEQAKLTGVEVGATADQTDAEIKTAYENNANTNAFTDDDASKLAGIELGATADQSAAEILAGWESASGLDDANLVIADGSRAFTGPPRLPSYTVAGLPAVSPAGQILFVSNETGGATLAFSDGTNWRRVQDRAIVS